MTMEGRDVQLVDGTTDFRCSKKLGQRDYLIVRTKPKNKPYWMSDNDYQATPDMTFTRVCKVNGKVLVTTMICPKCKQR